MTKDALSFSPGSESAGHEQSQRDAEEDEKKAEKDSKDKRENVDNKKKE